MASVAEFVLNLVTTSEALRFVARQGIALESARHRAVPNLADEVLGRRRRGNWWSHPRGREFFRLTRTLRSHPDILVCRLVDGKVTYVHRRLWPAVVRLLPALGVHRVAAIQEIHTETGAHRLHYTPLRRWVPPEVSARADQLTVAEARAQLGTAAADTGPTPQRKGGRLSDRRTAIGRHSRRMLRPIRRVHDFESRWRMEVGVRYVF